MSDNEFTDVLCLGGSNDGRRLRVYNKNKRRTLSLVVPVRMDHRVIFHDEYAGRSTIVQELYTLCSICSVELYIHNSLSLEQATKRLIEHYQRLP